MDTTDFIGLRDAHAISFEDMQQAIKTKADALKEYCQKESPSQPYVERENKFIASSVSYANITEAYIEQLALRLTEKERLLAEALEIVTLTQQEVEKHLHGNF